MRHPIAAIRDTLDDDLERCAEPHASHTRFLLGNEASTDDPEKAMPPADGPLVLGPGCSPQGDRWIIEHLHLQHISADPGCLRISAQGGDNSHSGWPGHDVPMQAECLRPDVYAARLRGCRP